MSQAASTLPEVAYGVDPDAAQVALPLASEGVQRIVWHTRYGDILIEVRGGVAWVNGERVERMAGDPAAAQSTTTAQGDGRP